jgi:hypothetical protein
MFLCRESRERVILRLSPKEDSPLHLQMLSVCPELTLFAILRVIQDDRKVTQPIRDTCPVCQKKLYCNKRAERSVILSVENALRVQRCMHFVSFPHI